VPSQAFDPRALKAVVFDIDGTLYRQGPLRRAMLFRLLAAHAVRPMAGWRTFAALRAYRHAQEQLRGDLSGDVAAAQVKLACERARMDRAIVAETVERWMEREPLAILRRHLQPGLVEFLDVCRLRGLRLATLSDYPGDDKLRALGVAHYFDVSLCAQSKEIGVFKPNPKGLQVALDRLGAAPAHTLYVGDRVDVDAPAAEAAGVPCAILTRTRSANGVPSYFQAENYYQLRDLLFGAGAVAAA
jgi:putative hydrolase of the HAD superfamily